MADGSVAYGSLPFKEQIAFFRAKKNVLTTSWTDLWQEQHDFGFMVAGANRIDLLVDLRSAIDRAIADGTGLPAFRRDFDKIVAKYGWQYTGGRNWRTRVIFETNLRTSYAAGRYAQLQRLKRVMPYWRYRHSDAVMHPRPLHLSWNNLVLLADDPWFQTHFCPNGWGCQCTIEAIDARGLKRLGKCGPDQAPPDDMQEVLVGKNGPHPFTVTTPAGVDPGFGYTPGRAAFEQLAQGTLTKAAKLPAALGAGALQPVLDLPRAQAALDTAFTTLQAAVKADTAAADAAVMLGALDPLLLRALKALDVTPSTAPIAADDAAAIAAASPNLPAALRDATAVLFDRQTGNLLFVGKGTVSIVRLGEGADALNTYAGAETASLPTLRARMLAGELQLVKGKL
jgi:hypothetical protein